MTATVKRRVARAGGWALAKRLIKPIPIVGSVFAVALAGYEIKKKGLLKGAVHVRTLRNLLLTLLLPKLLEVNRRLFRSPFDSHLGWQKPSTR
jgi:hypothetical protein